jgi:hypothetical protein
MNITIFIIESHTRNQSSRNDEYFAHKRELSFFILKKFTENSIKSIQFLIKLNVRVYKK